MSSVNREIYKLLWPPTEAEYQALLDEVVFKDEDISGSLNFFTTTQDILKAGSEIVHGLKKIPRFVGFKKNNNSLEEITWLHAEPEDPENVDDDAHNKIVVAPTQNIDSVEISIICF